MMMSDEEWHVFKCGTEDVCVCVEASEKREGKLERKT